MKVVGLIVEYNPFHNGHQYHLDEAKKRTDADYVVVVMSGNFVQRGTPAIVNKYTRSKIALLCGADLVFELPVCYASASAEFFALGAISLLDKLNFVDSVCFGSECGEITTLTEIAKFLISQPKEYNNLINKFMKQGFTFPKARAKAITTCLPDINEEILTSPNNILGIEYSKALLKLNSSIKPVTLSRKSSSYHSLILETPDSTNEAPISSATAIRKELIENLTLKNIQKQMPDPAFQLLKNEYKKTFPILEDDFSSLLKYKIMQESNNTLTSYTDVSTDLANRIKNSIPSEYSFSSFANNIKSKQWTLTRINRALTHILLNLKAKNINLYNRTTYCQYGRLLGLKKDSSNLLRIIQDNGNLPIITKVSNAPKQLSYIGLQMLEEDIFASHLYNLVVQEKYGTPIKNEYQAGVEIL